MSRIVDEEAKREEILCAAYEVIARDGLQGATIRAIAAATGCSTGMVVHYFHSKQDILEKTQAYAETRVRSRMVEFEQTSRGLALLRNLLLEVLPLDSRRRSNWTIWMSFWNPASNGESHSLSEQYARISEWHERISHALNQAKEDGEVAADLDVGLEVEKLAAFLEGLAVQVVIYKRKLGRRRLVELVDGCLRGLAV